MIRVLIVAAYASVRAGLHVLLAGDEDLAVVGEVSGSAEMEGFLQGLPDTRPHVILADQSPGDTSRLVQTLESNGEGDIGLVLLAEEREDYSQLIGTGLSGWAYLLREAEGEEIAGAIRAAAAGLIALDRSIDPLLAASSSRTRSALPVLSGEQPLTARESEVLQLMADGLPNKQIASRLSISLHTVKFHVASILAKLGATSRTEAVTLGARRGHVTL